MKNSFIISLLLIVSIAMCSCRGGKTVCEISKDYKGPGIIFIYKSDCKCNEDKITLNEKGWGRIQDKYLGGPFVFQCKENGMLMGMIDLSEMDMVTGNDIKVFGFGTSTTNPGCEAGKDVSFLEFFVGTKDEFINWRNNSEGVLEYFKSAGPDCCEYYRAGFE